MRHMFPTAILLAGTFFLLAKLSHPLKAYWCISWLPLTLFLVAIGGEYWYGFGWLTHVMFHLAYDASYLATLLGIVLVLNFILRRRPIFPVLVPVLSSMLPLAYLILFNP